MGVVDIRGAYVISRERRGHYISSLIVLKEEGGLKFGWVLGTTLKAPVCLGQTDSRNTANAVLLMRQRIVFFMVVWYDT